MVIYSAFAVKLLENKLDNNGRARYSNVRIIRHASTLFSRLSDLGAVTLCCSFSDEDGSEYGYGGELIN